MAATSSAKRPDRFWLSSGRRFIDTIANEGVFAGLELVVRRIGSLIPGQGVYFLLAFLTDRWYDWRNGVDTGGVIRLNELGLAPDVGRHYMGMAPWTWKAVFRHLPIEPERFTYIDLGCGKGRTLLLAAQAGFDRIVGVDVAPELLSVASQNAAKKNVQVELVCADATQYEFPNDPTVVFMFNPFYEEAVRRVAQNFAESVRRNPREVYVVYFRPAVHGVWEQAFRVFRENASIYPRYTIYRA